MAVRGIEFQIVGAANRKALRPIAVVVKGTCKRLSEEERRALLVVFKLMRWHVWGCSWLQMWLYSYFCKNPKQFIVCLHKKWRALIINKIVKTRNYNNICVQNLKSFSTSVQETVFENRAVMYIYIYSPNRKWK